MDELTPALKLCECGCGQPTRIAKYSDPRHGHVKGQPVRFLKGHSHRGKIVSTDTRAKLSAANSGENNYGWRGEEASYRAIHGYLCAHYPKSGICDECSRSTSRTEYALIHGREYTRNREDYRELCRPCHMRYDLGGSRVLADRDIGDIRARYARGEKQRDLAAEFGVSKALVGKTVRGMCRHHPDGHLTAEQVRTDHQAAKGAK